MSDVHPPAPSVGGVIDLATAIRTTGTVRAFTDEPVDDATLHGVLDDARFAPSGGNRQPWRVAIVRDVALRRELAALMQRVWDEYLAVMATGGTPFAVGGPTVPPPFAHSPNPLLDTIDTVPVVLAVAADRRRIALMDGNLDRPPMTNGGSIYPFCWNLLLAARARGLGGVLTTFLSREEPAAAPLLGLPADHALAATIFLGHPVHQPTKLRRQPVNSFATIDRFDGDSFDA
jgi:nitroreductase